MSKSNNNNSGTTEQNDFFDKLMSNPNSISSAFTGPPYNYWKEIKAPGAMGMGIAGDIDTLENDVEGLFNYIKVLISGHGGGSYPNGPLGNKYFLQTGGTCKAKDSGDIVPRFLYVNNIPDGNIPFISKAAGKNFEGAEGLLPGILEDLEALNPVRIFGAFKLGPEPACQKIKMSTSATSSNDYKSEQEEYVVDYDIRYLDPCLFTLMGDKNPITGQTCREGFNTRGGIQKHPNSNKHKSVPMNFNPGSVDFSEALFYFIISGLLLFVVYKLMRRSTK